jgi:hypothetical protein
MQLPMTEKMNANAITASPSPNWRPYPMTVMHKIDTATNKQRVAEPPAEILDAWPRVHEPQTKVALFTVRVVVG